MRWKNVLPVAMATGLSLLGSTASGAEGLYGGAEVGRVLQTFDPHYRFHYPRTPVTYRDTSDGIQLSITGGRRYALSERWMLGGEVRVSANDAEWGLSTSDPSTLSYKLPYTLTVSLVPEYRFTATTSVFGEFGLGQGRVEESKITSNATKSAYDFSSWEMVRTLGVGLRYRFADDKMLYAVYRRTSYANFSFDSHLANGTLVETISDDPRTDNYAIGFTYLF